MRETERQREKQAPCREPEAGLHPRTPGSCPEPKADTQPLSHSGAPGLVFLTFYLCSQIGPTHMMINVLRYSFHGIIILLKRCQ